MQNQCLGIFLGVPTMREQKLHLADCVSTFRFIAFLGNDILIYLTVSQFEALELWVSFGCCGNYHEKLPLRVFEAYDAKSMFRHGVGRTYHAKFIFGSMCFGPSMLNQSCGVVCGLAMQE